MTELLVDERGHAMRATWHPEARVFVFSLWSDGVCTGTLRLPPIEAARLSAYVVNSLAR